MTATLTTPTLLAESGSRVEWLAERRNGIGSSDIPKIAGLSKWGGALEVYFEKVEGASSDGTSESAQIGQELEPWLAGRAAARLDRQLVTVPTIAHAEHGHHRASLDRVTVVSLRSSVLDWSNYDGFVELKTALGYMALDWVDEGLIPPGYYAQVQWQRYVSGLPKSWIVALLGIPVQGEMIKVFEVPDDPEYQASLVKIADEFWERVQAKRPPAADGLDATVELLKKRWQPNPDAVSVLSPSAFFPARDNYRAACEDVTEATTRKQAAANAIRMQLGEAEAGVLDDQIVATWKADKRGIRTLRLPENPRSIK